MVVLSCAALFVAAILVASLFTASVLFALAAASLAGVARQAARELAASVARGGRPASSDGDRLALAIGRLIQSALGTLRS